MQIKLAADQNPILKGRIEVYQSDVKIDTDLGRRDIDLLVRIKNVVLVGEIKSTGRPVMPWEERTYIKDVFDTGPDQLLIRIEALKANGRNRELVGKMLRFHGDVDSLIWVPAVVTFQYEASGCKSGGIPIVDYRSLVDFFVSNTYEMGWCEQNGVETPMNSIPIYSDVDSAAARLRAYISNPLGVVARYPLISSDPIRGEDVLTGTGREIWSEQHYVRNYGLLDLTEAAEHLRRRWSTACRSELIKEAAT